MQLIMPFRCKLSKGTKTKISYSCYYAFYKILSFGHPFEILNNAIPKIKHYWKYKGIWGSVVVKALRY